MCSKQKIFKKEGINFMLSLPIKHNNRIKFFLLKEVKSSIREKGIEKGGLTYEKCKMGDR